MNGDLEQQILLGLGQVRAEAGARGAMFDQLLSSFAAAQPDPGKWLAEQKAEVLGALRMARKEITGDPAMQITIGQSINIAGATYDAIAAGLGIDLKA